MDLKTLQELVSIDSPTGYTKEACAYIYNYFKALGWNPEYTNKGAVRCAFSEDPILSIIAHTDTLGGMVSQINEDGTLRMTRVGGPSLPAYEGSYVRIRTLNDQVYTGTFLFDDPAVHVNPKLSSAKRELTTMHVRLDEELSSSKEVRELGIQVGDFICFETHYTELESGYVKSKFMDNKAGCFVIFELARLIKEKGLNVPVEVMISNYEEQGHGGSSGYSGSIKDLLVLDMGVIGKNQTGKETACSICAKDSSGPYDYDFRKTLVELAEKNNIPYAIDTYPFYSSDGSMALRAGHDFKVALIGPGVSASHGIERTHRKGIQATIDLCMAYIEKNYG